MKVYICIVILFSLFSPSYGGNLIPNDKCALVLASRFSLSEAKDYIRTEITDRSQLKIYLSDNGWYAITTALLNEDQAKEEVSKLKSNGKIPKDSYCSKGSRYIQEIKLDNNLNYITNKKTKIVQETNNESGKSWKKLDHYKVKDGLAIDVDTGLMWMRCSVGQKWTGSTCSRMPSKMSWVEAMNFPKSFKYAGFSDWRVPTIKELSSLRYCSSGRVKKGNMGCDGKNKPPAINDLVFSLSPQIYLDDLLYYWSSSSFASDSALTINFYYGYNAQNLKEYSSFMVRLVRSGK